MQADTLISNVNIASMQANGRAFGAIYDTCLTIRDGRIQSIGTPCKAEHQYDAQGAWLTPGLIDCHTHLLYAGNRADEFDQRLHGKTYQQIAKQGGGIVATVKATRACSEQTLIELGAQRLARMLSEGVTSVEIKSGYGLDLITERKMLGAATQLSSLAYQHIQRTYLGAHALPPEFSYKNAYIDFIVEHALPTLHAEGLIDAVDVFSENIGFSPAQCELIYRAAKSLNLPIKAHAEQLSNIQSARMAASYGAMSVDHVEYLAADDIPFLRAAGTVAVLLPGAFYFLRETQLPPIDALRQNGVPIAIASDFNPGSSPIGSLLTIMNMASVLFQLTPHEVLQGVTVNAAKALGMSNKGLIDINMDADLVLWNVDTPAEIVASIGCVKPYRLWIQGRELSDFI